MKKYDIGIVILATFSILLTICDFAGVIDLNAQPYASLDFVILIIFAIDYFGRLIKSADKWRFFKHNIFDLLAIIPFSSLFSVFRITRIARLTRFSRVFRVVGVSGKLGKRIDDFFKTNGFIYMCYTTITLIFIVSVVMSEVENVDFADALWWSIATTTSVNYDMMSPHSGIGRILAIVLSLVGIAMVSMLTSTIVAFFSKEPDMEDIKDELRHLRKENKSLISKLDQLLDQTKETRN